MTRLSDNEGFVQSADFAFGQDLNESSAEGHVEPSGQQEFPAQSVSVVGQVTVSPTLNCFGGPGGPGEGAGVGTGGGDAGQ